MALKRTDGENEENLRNLLISRKIVSFKIKNIECNPCTKSGDNYMSVITRLKIHGYSLSGPKSLSLILKRQIPSLSRRQVYRCDEAFLNETNAYNHVVPLLEKFMTETIFPKCYCADSDEIGELIVLEDLKGIGFRMLNRLAGLEINNCELIMKQIAKLHAASIAAKQLNNILFQEKCRNLIEIVYCREAEEFYTNIVDSATQNCLNSLQTSNADGSFTETIRMIEKLRPTLFEKMTNCINNSPENMNVVTHGDLWVNNIMFSSISTTTTNNTPCTSYLSNHNNNPTCNVKFVDLQAMRITSPVIDILHFLYTSTKRELRERYTLHLLETYCEALFANLEKQFKNSLEKLDEIRSTFSLENIIKEYYKNIIYGLGICMWVLPAVTFDPNNVPNLDLISEMNSPVKQAKVTQKLTDIYHDRLKETALEYYQKGYLNFELNND